MKKKVKDLTFIEIRKICYKHGYFCSGCPLFIKSSRDCAVTTNREVPQNVLGRKAEVDDH